MIHALGAAGFVRAAAKLMTPRRHFFAVVCEGAVAHYGWVTKGQCRHYPVEPDAMVIGPVETHPAFRGRGLATIGLASVVNTFAGKGVSVFYIDTADTNAPMQHVIEKCGFGKPVSKYVRPAEGL
jgi:RimJ/RimL family protein N-acetyltransferase